MMIIYAEITQYIGVSTTIGVYVGYNNAKAQRKTEVMASVFKTHISPS